MFLVIYELYLNTSSIENFMEFQITSKIKLFYEKPEFNCCY